MRISIDGGALCSPSYKRFGTYTFTTSILTALSQYDKANTYFVYSFCNKPSHLLLENNMFYKVIRPKILWMNVRVSLEEMTAKKDIFLALNQAIPLFTRSNVIGFSHGLSFFKYPKLFGYGAINLRNQLGRLMNHSRTVIVSSQRVREELIEVFPKKKSIITALPFGIPIDFTETAIRARKPFLLFVGSNHPIKNVEFLIQTFESFIQKKEFSHFELYLVGPFNSIRKRHKNITVFTKLSRENLQSLYQKATAYISASLYESFNLPVLEALSQKCQVVGMESAIIPELARYCIVCKDSEEFIEGLQKVALGKSKQADIAALKKSFSWKEYVNSLTKLYTI